MPLPNALVVWPILFDAVMLESCPCRSSPKRKLVIGVRVEERAPYSHFKWGVYQLTTIDVEKDRYVNSLIAPMHQLRLVSELDSLARNCRSESVSLVNALPAFVSVF